jgi:thioredoxin:protein disulfide reductase
MRTFFLLLIIVSLPAFILPAQSLSSGKKVNAEVILSSNKVQVGSTVQAAIRLIINKYWHVNSHHPTFDYLIGTSFDLQAREGIILADVQYPPGKPVALTFAEQPIDVYEDTVMIFSTIKFSDKLATIMDTLKANVMVQACNDQLCLAPSTVEVNIPVLIVGTGEPIIQQNQNIFALYKPSELKKADSKNEVAVMFDQKGSLFAFLAIFLIGLALNLTPCVYPMLSVTISLFGSQSETNIARVFIKAVIYVLGIASMYSILGVTASLGGGLFGSWLQSSWILGVIAGLLFVLALSSFGIYHIQMPYWLISKLGGIGGTGFIAIYLSGLAVGVFAAPCVGPPVIALLTFVAAKGDAVFGFWIFFTLSIGLGLPYLILGTFSGLIKKIPRSGSWLVWVEHIFGVILAGMSLFYLALAVAPKETVYVLPLVLVVGGIYLGFIDSSGKDKPALKKIQWIFGVVLILFGLFYANSTRDAGITWRQYSDMELKEAKENGMPVLLDFSADWCIPCLELERNTWTDTRVIEATKDISRLKVDLTYFDSPESEILRKKFNISGVPTVVFIRIDGNEAVDSRIVGFVPPDEFLAKLKQALSVNY